MFIKCKQCKNVLSIGDFREIPKTHSYEDICKYCIGIKQRAKKFNISEKQVRILLASTNCSICDYEFQNNKEKHIDHCHETDKVREVLCIRCNTALGNIKDDIKILGNMFKYLLKHSTQ